MFKTKKLKLFSTWLLTLLLSAFFLIPGIPVKAQTVKSDLVFTALGDSISYGYSAAPGSNYVNLLYNYLKVEKRYSGLKLKNLSVPGANTTYLLNNLKNNTTFKNSIKNSSVITLSIGGNNLLTPVIYAVAKAFNVNPVNNPNFLTELSQAILNTPEPTRSQIFANLLSSTSTLPAALTAGVQQFATDFPQIIKQIKLLAPKSKIYVLTIYNPFDTNSTYYSYFDQLIQGINLQLNKNAANNYELVNVYNAFKSHTGTPVVNFNLSQGILDPHPTTEGHKVIFNTHVKHVTSVTLNKTSASLKVGQSLKLTASVLPSNYITNPDVTWKSSNPSVAVVDNNGKVTAKAKGTAVITATTVDGGKTATCNIKVIVPVSKITLNATSKTLKVGQTFKLTAAITPKNATNKNVTWKSSNPSVAVVDNNGKVTAKSPGNTNITVTSQDGNATATCTIKVIVPVTKITLNAASKTLKIGQTFKLTAAITPKNATNKNITWKSSNPAVAIVDSTGKITAKAKGTAIITAASQDGNATAQCTITVKLK